MFTQEQQDFLVKFADSELAKISAENTRIQEETANQEKQALIDKALSDLKVTQAKEVRDLIASFEVSSVETTTVSDVTSL